MALKVIGAGYGRTGTLSTYTALNQLGYPCYHMIEVFRNKANKSHLDFWNNVANAPEAEHDWNKVFANYTAAVDNPACCVWQDLMKFYPDAKVLLTLHPRGAEGWYESTMSTIYLTETMWQFKLLKLLSPSMRKMGNMLTKLVWQYSQKGTTPNKPAAMALYESHIEEVKALVPPEKLLIFTVNQGWEPLCKFLGVPVPETAFPNVNDKAQFKKTNAFLATGAYVILGLTAICLVAIIFALIKLLGKL